MQSVSLRCVTSHAADRLGRSRLTSAVLASTDMPSPTTSIFPQRRLPNWRPSAPRLSLQLRSRVPLRTCLQTRARIGAAQRVNFPAARRRRSARPPTPALLPLAGVCRNAQAWSSSGKRCFHLATTSLPASTDRVCRGGPREGRHFVRPIAMSSAPLWLGGRQTATPSFSHSSLATVASWCTCLWNASTLRTARHR